MAVNVQKGVRCGEINPRWPEVRKWFARRELRVLPLTESALYFCRRELARRSREKHLRDAK
jgi:hypothetical protein